MRSQTLRSLLRHAGSAWLAPALVGSALTAPQALASAAFQAVEVNQEAFVIVAAPVGTSGEKAQLQIYEQLKANQRPCFQVNGTNPGKVAPLLGTFDFTGICSRYVDSLGYSPRVGSQDLGTSYRLTVRKLGDDTILVAAPSGRSAAGKPELLVARTYGAGGPVEYLAFKLEPGWRLMRRAFGGKRLGHIYVYRETWPGDTAAATDPDQTTVTAEPVASPPSPQASQPERPST